MKYANISNFSVSLRSLLQALKTSMELWAAWMFGQLAIENKQLKLSGYLMTIWNTNATIQASAMHTNILT